MASSLGGLSGLLEEGFTGVSPSSCVAFSGPCGRWCDSFQVTLATLPVSEHSLSDRQALTHSGSPTATLTDSRQNNELLNDQLLLKTLESFQVCQAN